ncbi:MAG: NAD(P)H-hydrate dehydratase, partial [Candidatus Margulisiibacteriota bacterium]
MKLISAKEMQKLDQHAIEVLGIPQIALMESAGRAVAEEISKVKKSGTICVVAYKGNNGGDGLVAARYLKNLNYEVLVFLLCKKEEVLGSAQTNLEILSKMRIPIYERNLLKLEHLLKKSNVVVDAIFGVGFKGKISGDLARAVELINKYHKKSGYYVVAVDVPSGVDATTGKIDPHSVCADLTVTFAYPKVGLLKYPAVKNIGKLVVADIGIPYDLEKQKTQKLGKQIVDFYLPRRLFWTHKGDYGRVLIVAGSRNMSGAAYLTARAALRSGAGLVYLAVPQSIQKLVAPKTREVITLGLPETKEGTIALKALSLVEKISADCVAIGPGLTTHEETKEFVRKLILQIRSKWLIVDADGLNSIADNQTILKKAKSPVVITPHPGEMSRLFGQPIKKIQKNRINFAKLAAKKWKVKVVLKGAYTVVSNGKDTWINSSGNPGMASAGVGDVLTGMLAGLLPQGVDLPTIVYLHGLAGDLASKEKGERGMIASD